MLKEFKEFALKGNVLEIAVGLILALAFVALVNAFIATIVMPLIAAIFDKPSFDSIVWTISGTDILIGTFLTAVVDFLLIAIVLFLIVKAANRMKRPADEPEAPTEVELLVDIRDSLARRPV